MTTYSTGTISIAAGSVTLTGVGTTWLTSNIRAGDMVMAMGLQIRIGAVNSNTSITLARPWPGSALSGAAYDIDYRDDGTRAFAAINRQAEALGSGSVESLANLLTAANRLPYFSGQNVLALTDFTAFARGLLDDTNAATMRATLGIDDFGLGTTVKAFPGSDLSVTDNSIPSGTYFYNPNTMTGGPIAALGSVIHVRRSTSGGEVQLFLLESATYGGRVYVRSRTTGAWAPWNRLYGSYDIVGTVGQTDGIPTGGLFQPISNANGIARRTADGIQECWHEVTATRISAYACRASGVAFPASFVDANSKVICTPILNTGVGFAETADERRYWGGCGPTGITASGCTLDIYTSTGAPSIPVGATVKLHYHAFGRWY